jgi:threonine aldolase
MANQAALMAQTRPGDVVLAGCDAHILLFEAGAASALSGVQINTLGTGAFFDGDDVRAALHPPDHHFAPVSLVAIENTHNKAGGRIFPLEKIEHIAKVAREAGLRLHLDGARLFNAVVASDIPAARWAAPFDTVSFCLSKGLGAPVGSLVCGDAETIDRVHRSRKRLGGGMRQAGILAAAGLHALDHHVERLAEDHVNARRLAEGLAALGIPVDPLPETNMVLFHPVHAEAFAEGIGKRSLLINTIAPGVFRAVTHLDVSSADVDEALARIGDTLAH